MKRQVITIQEDMVIYARLRKDLKCQGMALLTISSKRKPLPELMPRPQPLLEVAVLLSSPVRQVTRLLTLASEASVAAHASMDSGSPMLELFIRSSTERSQIHTSPRMLTERTSLSARKAKTSICVLTEQEVRQEPYPFRMQLTQTQMWALSERKEQSPP